MSLVRHPDAPDLQPGWRIDAHAAPALHRWQDEYVVHHALSNDTHRLSEPAGLILQELMAAGVAGVARPGQACALTDEAVQACLAALHELGFVARC
jgi:hypothetical protein